MSNGYPMVDLQTTGLNASGYDRIGEIATAHVDDTGWLLGDRVSERAEGVRAL
ncbi:hypothetical protein [Raineyella sp. LH-20]|uniref:hypothetical protein n=1 Tax=Raineyella sp. LH-20 TaxID=3081204 RepID=UPI002954E026|nr:hypothetical protein [Raineyella sp. LH-20]WOP19308.1 hypothetical protein R0146_03280 [Raineyella sp. LH-20]